MTEHVTKNGAGNPPAADTDTAGWTAELAVVERDGMISTPVVREAARWLAHQLPAGAGSRVLDVGSGPGHAAAILAEAFPHNEVIAVDPTPQFVARATERFTELGLTARARAVHGEIGAPALTELAPADLVWCASVVHHLPDPVAALHDLGQLLAQDRGVLAIVEGGLPARFLPGGYGVGRPSFVNRLEATLSDYYLRTWSLTEPAVGGHRDWPLLLADAGLRHRASRTFLLDLPAPVDDQVRGYVIDRFTTIRDLVGDRLDREDATALSRLLDPNDPAAFVNRPDLFVLSATTVHLAGPSHVQH